MSNKILSQEEILCMQYAGMLASQIMSSQLESEKYDETLGLYMAKAEKILMMQQECGVVTLTFQNEQFPYPFRKIGADCPAMIHCLGNLSLLASANVNHIAIIGARAASPEGNRKAYELGKELADKENIIISGLALGCDKSAHEGCLAADGKTIAIVASGLNIVHPKENAPLQQQILENGGLILSEHPFGIKANPKRLIARNRLQAALSKAVILVECPEHSGSMHTMHFARKYHKKCFAVSYPEYSDINAGNELLLNQNLANPI